MKNNRRIMIIAFLSLIVIFIFFCFNKKDYTKENIIISMDSQATTEKNITVSMKTKKGYKIYYTLDGSIPNKKSKKYKRPIKLDKYSTPDNIAKEENSEKIFGDEININANLPRAVVLRAVAIAPNGERGDIITKTYFIDIEFKEYFGDAAVISLVTDPDNLLDYEKGIMVKGKIYDEWKKNHITEDIINDPTKHHLLEGNFMQKGKKWEREATIDFFDGNNKVSWSENVGIRLKGNYTRSFSQKSFNIYFREEYGSKKLEYDLIPNNKDINNQEINEYKSFSLRNGGNDNKLLKFKDLWLQNLVKKKNVDTQSGRVAVLFLNGEYWGVYVLQEKYSDYYYSKHYDIDKDNIIVIKEDEIEEGKDEDIKLYEELIEYTNKDLSNPKVYEEFKSIVDIQSMLDYYAIEIYIGNNDWGIDNIETANTQLWRVRETSDKKYEDGKWRWSLYDLEYSSSMYNQKGTAYDFDSIERAKKTHPLFASAMKNDSFRKSFYNTLRDIGKNNYSSENVEKTLAEYYEQWSKYYLDNDRRFGTNDSDRNISMMNIKDYFEKRYDYITNR